MSPPSGNRAPFTKYGVFLSTRMRYVICRLILGGFLGGCCSTVQGVLDWFEVDLGFPELVYSDSFVYCRFFLPLV